MRSTSLCLALSFALLGVREQCSKVVQICTAASFARRFSVGVFPIHGRDVCFVVQLDTALVRRCSGASKA